MTKSTKCKELLAEYMSQDLKLGGPKHVTFEHTNNNNKYTISIDQIIGRKISIVSDHYTSSDGLFDILCKIEKLIMLFDGRFVHLNKITLDCIKEANETSKEEIEKEYTDSRLAYYSSADYCITFNKKLLDYENVITGELFIKWCNLIDELSIAHQLFLYCTGAVGYTVDLRLAFLTELAEPLVEIIKVYTPFCQSLKPGEKNGTSLKMCLDFLISFFGKDIFQKEMQANYSDFLSKLVKNRNIIMHIKRNQENCSITDKEYIEYNTKIVLLYRIILFELLGIDRNEYELNITECVNRIDEFVNDNKS